MMKGLLIKDLKLMKNQKSFFVICRNDFFDYLGKAVFCN